MSDLQTGQLLQRLVEAHQDGAVVEQVEGVDIGRLETDIGAVEVERPFAGGVVVGEDVLVIVGSAVEGDLGRGRGKPFHQRGVYTM